MSLWSTLVQALGGKKKDPDPGSPGHVPRGAAVQADLGAVGGGQASLYRLAVKVGLAVLLGAVIVAVVVLATNSGGGKADLGSTHAAGTPASPGSAPAATATAPASTTSAATPTATTTTTTTTPTTTSTDEGVIP